MGLMNFCRGGPSCFRPSRVASNRSKAQAGFDLIVISWRLIAVPGTRDYGYLTVRTQLFVEVKALIDVKPAAFQPPPKVDSTVIRLEPRPRAAELGLSRVSLYKKLHKYGLFVRKHRNGVAS